MKRNLKRLPREKAVRGQWAAIYVSLNPKGVFTLTRRTWERFGEPKAVHILFDDVNNTIYLQPCSPGLKDAYSFVKYESGARRVFAFRLMTEFGIKLKETVQFFDAEIDRDGMLVLDLRSARVSPRAANHWRTRHKQQKPPQTEFPLL